MKKSKHIYGLLIITVLALAGCSEKDDNNSLSSIASAEEFNAIQKSALIEKTQTFQFNTEEGWVTLTSENGVKINITTECLTLNGNAVTGDVDLEFVELFDKGDMLITNKPTMGIISTGDKSLLISGGEFFIEATQDGKILETTCSIELEIPANLTGGIDSEMLLWNGTIDENGDLAWEEDKEGEVAGRGADGEVISTYYAFLNVFGWSNVDKFYSDTREKTTILVDVPEGYNDTNSAVYLSYDGEDSGLAQLDTYNESTALFSEHYGQIPIGLECHVIFVTEEDGDWKYAIKEVTIVEDEIITIIEDNTATVTESQLVNLINALP